MSPAVLFVALLLGRAEPQLSAVTRLDYARAVVHAVGRERRRCGACAPSYAEVVAIIRHESHGRARVCANEPTGGSSRGLMQVRAPDVRCDAAGDVRYGWLYGPWANVRRGVRIAARIKVFETRRHEGRHDWLDHYACRRPGCRASREIRALAGKLEEGRIRR